MCEVTQQLLAFLKQWEDVRRKVYKDTAKKLTVGVGHLVLPQDNLRLGDVITETQVDAFLSKDIQTALGAVNELVKVPLTAGQCIALTSFTFNLGAGALRRSALLRLLNSGAPKERVGKEFGKWVNSGGQRTQGLVNRRAAERAIFLG